MYVYVCMCVVLVSNAAVYFQSQGQSATSLKYVKQTFPRAGYCHTLGLSSPGTFCTGDVHEREHPDQ